MTLRSGPEGVAGSDPARRSFRFLTPHEARTVEAIMGRWAEYRAAARKRAEAHFDKELWLAKHRRIFQELTPA